MVEAAHEASVQMRGWPGDRFARYLEAAGYTSAYFGELTARPSLGIWASLSRTK